MNYNKELSSHDWKTVVPANSPLEFERKWVLDMFGFLVNINNKELERGDPIIQTTLPYSIVDELNAFCCTIPTSQAYNTKDGLSADGKLLDISIKWKINNDHRKRLTKFSQRHKVSVDEVMLIDSCIRVKQARGHKWIVVSRGDKTALGFIIDGKHYETHKMGSEAHYAPVLFNSTLDSPPVRK
jgi:hypothetical protein